jgi:hypothetical protein
MSSAAVHIADMLAATRDGTLPGALTADRSCWEFPRLAYVGSRGATHYWTVRVCLLDGDGDRLEIEDWMLETPVDPLAGYRAEITVESLQKDGKVRDVVPTYVAAGKNLGRKNATNALTQALRDALGLYNKQKKRADIVDASRTSDAATSTEAAPAAAETFDEMPPPQLVKKLGDGREATLTPASFADGVTVQRKLNGVHLVAFLRDGKLFFYSRTSREYPMQALVAAELERVLAAAPPVRPGEYGVPEGCAAYDGAVPYLAGELYLHGKNLNWISGQARRGDNDGILQYHVFDVFFPGAKARGHDMESRHRQAYIDALFAASPGLAHVVRVENTRVANADEMNALAREYLRAGYEGAIARKDGAGFRYSYSNYHSSNVLKIKPIHDSEFPVVGYTQGTRGKDVGALIWECAVPEPLVPGDDRFAVVPKDMTYEERYCLFRKLGEPAVGADGKPVLGADGEPRTRFDAEIRGLPLTVEYAELSAKTGKPLQAKALAFRTYEGGPANDPARKLLSEC